MSMSIAVFRANLILQVKEAELAEAWASFSQGAEQLMAQIESQGSAVGQCWQDYWHRSADFA